MSPIITRLSNKLDAAAQTHFIQADLTHAWTLAGEPDQMTHIIEASDPAPDLHERLRWLEQHTDFDVTFVVVNSADEVETASLSPSPVFNTPFSR